MFLGLHSSTTGYLPGNWKRLHHSMEIHTYPKLTSPRTNAESDGRWFCLKSTKVICKKEKLKTKPHTHRCTSKVFKRGVVMKPRVHLRLLSFSSGGKLGQLHHACPGIGCVCQFCDGQQVYLSWQRWISQQRAGPVQLSCWGEPTPGLTLNYFRR